MLKQIRNRIKMMFTWVRKSCSRIPPLRKWGGKLAYYGGVLAVLCAVAYAAEIYRSEDMPGADDLILPAVELESAMQAAEEVPDPCILPEDALCIRPFSALPEWNENLRRWESHTAVDYTFENGQVPCLQAGTVLTIGESGVLGGFVELQCGDVMMRYASIQPDAELEIGMELAAGHRIGTADHSMPAESMQQEHLHLEVWKNGKTIDIQSLI